MARSARIPARLAVTFLLVAAVAAGTTGTASAVVATTRVGDTADAHVAAAHPNRNYGSALTIVSRRGADIAYLRFVVRGLPPRPQVRAIRLNLWIRAPAATGFTVHRVRTAWTERGVTWNSRPRLYPTTLARHGRINRAGWLTFSLPRTFVRANGTYSVAVLSTGSAPIEIAARGSRTPPRLGLDVTAVAPVAQSAPSVSGAAVDGNRLTVVHGGYAAYPKPSFTDVWLRCDSSGSGCESAATGPSYTLTSSDVGHTFRIGETASNVAGSVAQSSTATARVTAAPPSSTSPPTIEGQPVVTTTLTATTGSWIGTMPQTYAFQWQRCAAGGSTCQDISGATSSSYAITSSDAGSSLAVRVTAKNQVGHTSATSAATAPVTSAGSGSSDPVVAAAGDIACDPASTSYNNGAGSATSCRELSTSDLLVNTGLTAVLALGDNQYFCGSLSAYQQSYAGSWGRVKSITHPAPGNHEYLTSGGTGCTSTNAGAKGYFSYFGSAAGPAGRGWYSFDIGTWHVISLDSNCSDIDGCGTTSPEGTWLASDLSAHSNRCTLAFWHVPLYSSGGRASGNMQSIYDQLYRANADLILTGHDHIYERFAPQDAFGHLDRTRGIREFVVGTGGADHTGIASVMANSEVRDDTTFGVLRITLHPTSYDWTFEHEAGGGTFADSGSQTCH